MSVRYPYQLASMVVLNDPAWTAGSIVELQPPITYTCGPDTSLCYQLFEIVSGRSELCAQKRDLTLTRKWYMTVVAICRQSTANCVGVPESSNTITFNTYSDNICTEPFTSQLTGSMVLYSDPDHMHPKSDFTVGSTVYVLYLIHGAISMDSITIESITLIIDGNKLLSLYRSHDPTTSFSEPPTNLRIFNSNNNEVGQTSLSGAASFTWSYAMNLSGTRQNHTILISSSLRARYSATSGRRRLLAVTHEQNTISANLVAMKCAATVLSSSGQAMHDYCAGNTLLIVYALLIKIMLW